ncbi:YcxB family protein [Salibacterium aidingense]|uniref:YcxB family protein n=1 Tax=Salibacterium aidingense TaxID=384933 RepID=UPI0004194690|nr:YcxB family protein [Salibacterium aidingense]
METNEFSIQGRFTLEDVVAHHMYHRRNFFNTSFLFMFVLLFLLFSDGMEQGFGLSVLSALLSAGVVRILGKHIIKRSITKKLQKESFTEEEVTFTFSPAGVQQRQEHHDDFVKWRQMRRIYEQPELFQLYLTNQKTMVLPKHFYHSEEDIRRFKQLLRAQKDIRCVYLT